MKLLIVTQAIDRDDPILGFFHRWVEEFSTRVDSIEVICLKEGKHSLPKNVSVHSLGKEKDIRSQASGFRFQKFAYALRFLSLVWKLRKNYDTVFVHMNPEYLILGGWFWQILGKKVSLWYVHRSVTFRLRFGALFCNRIYSASRESFRMHSKKLLITGHGIAGAEFPVSRDSYTGPLRLITVGRISKTKHIDGMLPVLDELTRRSTPFTFTVVGGPVTPEDMKYANELSAVIALRPDAQNIHMLGNVSHDTIQEVLAHADVFLHMSRTGSLDKAVLEACAAGVVPVSSSSAFASILPQGLFLKEENPSLWVDAIQHAARVSPESVIAIAKQHSLPSLIERVVEDMKKL